MYDGSQGGGGYAPVRGGHGVPPRGLSRGRGRGRGGRGAHQMPFQQSISQQQAPPMASSSWQQQQQTSYEPYPSSSMPAGMPSSQTHQRFPQQQQQPPHQSISEGVGVSLLGQNTQLAQNLAMNYVNNNMSKFSWLSLDIFRYYFHVSNVYVVNKLKVLLFPCLHKRWSRERSPDHPSEFKVPSQDLNAPDLYIPLMSFITYILLMGFIMGISDEFTPEVLGVTASWAMAVLFFEVVTLRGGLYLIGSGVEPPPPLDLVAYSSYKFVILVIDLVIWVASSHNSTVYWIVSLFTGISMAIFMARTLQRVFVVRVESSSLDPTHKTSRQYFLIFVALIQIPICLFLGRTITRA